MILMLKAYFDDAGTHGGSPLAVMGGLIGTIAQWDKLEDRWEKQLANPLPEVGKPSLSMFHMAECEASRGEFRNYKLPERMLVAQHFRRHIAECDFAHSSSVVDVVAWDELVTGPVRELLGPAIEVCFVSCLDRAKEFASGSPYGDKIAIEFDQGLENDRLHKVIDLYLLDRIAQNSPSFFEQLIVNLLVAMGYGGSHKNAAEQLGRTGDGGVDGVINEDRLGLDRVYVQAKRYASGNGVGRPEVQAFVGSLVGLGATKGVFVTTSTFSPQARDFVRHLSQRVILLDGQNLADLMIEHGVGVRTSRAIEFKRLDEDFFSEDD
jgi:Restriction endonuclease